MIGKYRRFYGDSDAETMRIPVKRFFLLYRQIRRLQAEEALLQLRIISQPYTNGDDGFVRALQRDAQIENNEKVTTLHTADDLGAWGIGVVSTKQEAEADDLTQVFHIEGGE